MTKRLLVASIATATLFAGNVTKLELNAKYSANIFHTKGEENFAKLVNKYSNGIVKITVNADSSLINGNPLKAVKDGTASMTIYSSPIGRYGISNT